MCVLLSCGTRPSNVDSPARPRGVVFSDVAVFYDVVGSTADAMHASMSRNGPRVHDVPVFALTEWEVTWRLRPAGGGECRLERTEVLLTIRTTLPQWKSAAASSAELREDWSHFEAALKVHEAGHRELGIRAASAVAAELQQRRQLSGPSCDLLVTAANAAAHNVLRRFHEQNVQYDRTTQHGATQGVHWPQR